MVDKGFPNFGILFESLNFIIGNKHFKLFPGGDMLNSFIFERECQNIQIIVQVFISQNNIVLWYTANVLLCIPPILSHRILKIHILKGDI